MFHSRAAIAVGSCIIVAGCGGAQRPPLANSPASAAAGWTTYPAAVEPGWEFADLRTNGLNDGSMFEACTAYTQAELFAVGLDAATVREGSPNVDEDHLRGCVWDTVDIRGGFLSQEVVNYGTHADDVIAIYQRDYEGIITFFPNEFRRGRIISTWHSSIDFRCYSEFEVEGAKLTTEGAAHRNDARTVAQMCERIRPFVDLALSKALPP